MTHYAIETILVLIALLILYVIAWKQEQRIEVLEEKAEHPLYSVNVPTVWIGTGTKQPEITITSSDPSFSKTLATETKRMNKSTPKLPKSKKPVK